MPGIDGRIEGAAWVNGSMPGKFALRFGWPDSGVRLNIPVECRQLTLAAWVWLDILPDTQDFMSLLMSDGEWIRTRGKMHWQIYSPQGKLAVGITGADQLEVDLNCRSRSIFNGQSIDRWRFAAIVCDLAGGKIGFYLDGELADEATPAVPASAAIEIGPATIGRWDHSGMHPGDDRILYGRMEELMVFRAALAPGSS